jgi:hypothetical protein
MSEQTTEPAPETSNSSQAECESDPVARRGKWLGKLADEFIKLESAMPVNNLLPETEGPSWVQNLEREIRNAMFPVAKLKKGLALTPQRLGGILGHQCAVAVWMMEYLTVELEKSPVGTPDPKIEEQAAAGLEFIRRLHDDWYCGLRRLAKRALGTCVDQAYPDMREFLLAYSSAFARKPSNFSYGSFGNSAFEVYVFMLCHWRMVEKLESVRELHELLVKHLGPQRTGELKRIEKICQRIGLRFRKPGAPRKNNSDT